MGAVSPCRGRARPLPWLECRCTAAMRFSAAYREQANARTDSAWAYWQTVEQASNDDALSSTFSSTACACSHLREKPGNGPGTALQAPWYHLARSEPPQLPCPARKYDLVSDLQVFRVLGGIRVFVDQAAQDGFSADLSCVDVGHGGAGSATFIVRDALGDALMPGGVVVHLVFGQDRVQMPAAEDQHPVQYRSAQGADEAFAGRIHARRLDSGTQDPGTSGLEHGVERGREVRSAVTDEELDVLEPLVEGQGEVAGLLHRPLAGGAGGDSAKVHPAGAMLDEHQDVQSSQQHGVHVQEVDRADPGGLGVQELPPGRTRPARSRIDACGPQDLPDGGRCDRHAIARHARVGSGSPGPHTPARVRRRKAISLPLGWLDRWPSRGSLVEDFAQRLYPVKCQNCARGR